MSRAQQAPTLFSSQKAACARMSAQAILSGLIAPAVPPGASATPVAPLAEVEFGALLAAFSEILSAAGGASVVDGRPAEVPTEEIDRPSADEVASAAPSTSAALYVPTPPPTSETLDLEAAARPALQQVVAIPPVASETSTVQPATPTGQAVVQRPLTGSDPLVASQVVAAPVAVTPRPAPASSTRSARPDRDDTVKGGVASAIDLGIEGKVAATVSRAVAPLPAAPSSPKSDSGVTVEPSPAAARTSDVTSGTVANTPVASETGKGVSAAPATATPATAVSPQALLTAAQSGIVETIAGQTPDAPTAPAPAPPTAAAQTAAMSPRVDLSSLSQATIETTVQIAAQITRRLEGRSTRFEMALTPEGLGRVDISLDIDADGQLAARLAFDNPAAATDLRGRADELRRQLEDAGFTLARDALDFSERDASSSGGGFDRRQNRAFANASRMAADADLTAPAPAAWISLSLTPQGVDMKV